MAKDNTGLLVVGGLAALLLLGRKGLSPPPGPGVTKVMGSLAAVNVAQGPRMGSHQLLKAPGDIAIISATYSVAAFKNGDEAQPIPWPYKFLMQVTHNNTVLKSEMTAPFVVPPMNNQVWGFSYLVGQDVLNGWLLNVTVQLYGEHPELPGAFTVLANKVHLDAIEIVAGQPTVVTGAISQVAVAQGSVGRRRGPFFAPPPFGSPRRGRAVPQPVGMAAPFYAPPPGRRPILAPPPFRTPGPRFSDPQEGLVLAGKSSPWLHRTRAPI